MKTVLIIDDEQECLKTLAEVVSRFGHQVIARPDAKAALAVLREGAMIDLVITDYSMPEMDGLEFLVLLKRLLPSVPIIMLTGYGDIETYLKARSLGVSEFVHKPVKLKELDRIVKFALLKAEEILVEDKNETESVMPRIGLKSPESDEHKQCRFMSGKYMVSCGRSRDVYVPSFIELRDYCENPMHRLCPRYQQYEPVLNSDRLTQRQQT